MSYNLDLLRQNYCQPVTVTGKATHYLFPLEKECDQGVLVQREMENWRFAVS